MYCSHWVNWKASNTSVHSAETYMEVDFSGSQTSNAVPNDDSDLEWGRMLTVSFPHRIRLSQVCHMKALTWTWLFFIKLWLRHKAVSSSRPSYDSYILRSLFKKIEWKLLKPVKFLLRYKKINDKCDYVLCLDEGDYKHIPLNRLGLQNTFLIIKTWDRKYDFYDCFKYITSKYLMINCVF